MKENQQNSLVKPVIKHVPVSMVTTGMITAKDVYSRNDQLILNKGTILEAEAIAKVMFYAVDRIYVYEPDEGELNGEGISEQLQKSPEFFEFKKNYHAAISNVTISFHHIVDENREVSQHKLLNSISDIINAGRSKVQIFNMLQCIRDYDDVTYTHCVNVALICNIFADWLNMSRDEKISLTMCGLMHDIGKLKIPKVILTKPAKLTEKEYEIVKQHPVFGYELLKDRNFDSRVKIAALQHHERYNGQGYVNGSNGDKIDSFAMIVAIADVYDALTSKRVYRGAICPFEVIRLFEQEGIRRYNPRYLIPLLNKIVETYINYSVRLSNSERGEIIMVNQHALSMPVVKVGDHFIDLSKNKDITIESVF